MTKIAKILLKENPGDNLFESKKDYSELISLLQNYKPKNLYTKYDSIISNISKKWFSHVNTKLMDHYSDPILTQSNTNTVKFSQIRKLKKYRSDCEQMLLQLKSTIKLLNSQEKSIYLINLSSI